MEWNILNVTILISSLTTAIVSIINAWKSHQNGNAIDENTSLTRQATNMVSHNCDLARTAVARAEEAVVNTSAITHEISNVVNQIQSKGKP